MSFLHTALQRSRNILLHQQYIPTDYYVLDFKQLVYISIPKVACTSLKIALMGDDYLKGIKAEYMNIHALAGKYHTHHLSRKRYAYYKFAFVRNPFDRLVSCYEDKVRKPAQHTGQYYFQTKYNTILIRRLFGSHFHPDMSFRDFVQLVSRIPDFLSDGHFKSQYATLYRHGRRIPDYVGHFERLEDDWTPLAERFQLPLLNKANPTIRDDWKQYYLDSETVSLVTRRYHKDIQAFDYADTQKELVDAAAAMTTAE